MAENEKVESAEDLSDEALDEISGGVGYKLVTRYDCYLNGEIIRYFYDREQALSFAACDPNIRIEESPARVYAD